MENHLDKSINEKEEIEKAQDGQNKCTTQAKIIEQLIISGKQINSDIKSAK